MTVVQPEPRPRKRVKWEPAALMVLVLGLGLWAAFGPYGKPRFPIAPSAVTQDVRIGNTRGVLEAFTESNTSDQHKFRLWIKGGPNAAKVMSQSEAEALLGADLVRATISSTDNRVLRWLNITSWTNLVWVGIGLIGQLAFSGRMVLQWLISEKERKSVIGESFWWFSLFGGLTLFTYFVWRQDPVAILGQASGIVVYARNLRLIHKHRRRLTVENLE